MSEPYSVVRTYKSCSNNSSDSNQNRKGGLSSRLKNLEIEELKLDQEDFVKIHKAFKNSGKFIGKGAFGQVYGGKYQGKKAVAKFCKYSGLDNKKYILNEINSLNIFDHPNVVKIHAFAHKTDKDVSGDGEFVLILEHGGNNLANMVENDLITPMQIIEIIIQVLTGLDYIHKFGNQKLIHRDIKPENIFIRATGSTLKVKIGDFGCIRKTSSDNSATVGGAKGTKPYMAFEVFQQHIEMLSASEDKHFDPQVYTQSGDTLAVGLSLFFMVSGNVPFSGNHTQKCEKVPCLPDYFPNDFVQIQGAN